MAATTKLVVHLGILGLLFLLVPALIIADTFTYTLAVGSFTPPPSGPPGPTLAAWSASFQSNQLLNWATLTVIPGIDVSSSGAPAATYSVFDIAAGRTALGVDEFTVEWFSPTVNFPSELFYTSHFSVLTPPETTGIFVATDTLTQDTDGFQPGPSTTLTITQVQAPVSEPGSLTLVFAAFLALAVTAIRFADKRGWRRFHTRFTATL